MATVMLSGPPSSWARSASRLPWQRRDADAVPLPGRPRGAIGFGGRLRAASAGRSRGALTVRGARRLKGNRHGSRGDTGRWATDVRAARRGIRPIQRDPEEEGQRDDDTEHGPYPGHEAPPSTGHPGISQFSVVAVSPGYCACASLTASCLAVSMSDAQSPTGYGVESTPVPWRMTSHA